MQLITVILIFTCLSIHKSEAVYTVDTTKFATKNSYASSSSDNERQEGRTTLDIINSYCTALQVTSVLRHGIRNPTSDDIKNINAVLQKMQDAKSTQPWVEKLEEVARKFPLQTEGDLVDAGNLEQRGIGYRLGNVFSKLFSDSGSERLSFSSTSKNRAKDSCTAFQSGFFQPLGVSPNITIRNDVLRFYDRCRAYDALQSSAVGGAEYKKFQNNSYPSISQRYALTLSIPSMNITHDEMASIFELAGIEFAVFGSTHWSQTIHPEDLLKLEYSVDLESYYKVGYGFPLNYEMSCPLMSELFLEMDKVFTNKEYMKGNFYFGHSATVVPLMGLLGLFKDSEPLTAHNYDRMHNRAYKTGRIDPFSTSVGFVQYNCDVGKISSNKNAIPVGIFPEDLEQNMTLLLIKEQPTQFPMSKDLLCPYSKVRQFYSPNIDDCNFDDICQNSALSRNSGYPVLLILISIAFSQLI